jgi:hypothetical protein
MMWHDLIRPAFRPMLIPAPVIALLGALASDLFAPWGNVALVLAGIAAWCAVMAFLLLTNPDGQPRPPTDQRLLAHALALTAMVALLLVLWAGVSAIGPQHGYLATRFAPLKAWQQRMLARPETVQRITSFPGSAQSSASDLAAAVVTDTQQSSIAPLESAPLASSPTPTAKRFEVEFLPYFAPSGVTIGVALPDPTVKELRYSVNDPTPITSTGVITNGARTVVNLEIGPLPLEKGTHTLYIQYVDAQGEKSPIYSHRYTVQDILINLAQLPFDDAAGGSPLQVTLAVVGGQPDALYTYRLSVDEPTLDQSQQGLGGGTVMQTLPLSAGEHTLYVQAALDGEKTKLVEHPWIVK